MEASPIASDVLQRRGVFVCVGFAFEVLKPRTALRGEAEKR